MRLLLLILLLPSLACWSVELRIAVAANFKPTLEQINPAFEAATGHRTVISSASTGALHNQIRFGAPFDVFLAADRESVAQLASAGYTAGGAGFCYASGRLVLVGGDGSLDQLRDARLSVAIANPVTAPYGAAAAAVLARAEFASGRERKLVRGANVAQAYQFWHSGSVDLALLPAALAAGTPVPDAWHQPIAQYAVLLRRAADKPAARAYLNWLRSDTVRKQIIDAGYNPCP